MIIRGNTVLESQRKVKNRGIILEGETKIIQDDFYGDRSIMELLSTW